MDFSQGFQGAMGGALAGGGIGGPLGGLIGGGLGLLGGLFGGGGNQAYRDRLSQMEQQFGGRQAPQLGQAAQGAFSSFRGNQAGLISMLEQMARGQGPSLATQLMKQSMDRAGGTQAALAAGAAGRGSGAGGAMRNAANNVASIQSQGARDTGMMRTQEQMGALNQLGLTLHGARGMDEEMNRYNAGAQNNFSIQNLDAQLRMMGMNDQSRLQAMQMLMGGAGPGMGTQILAGGAQMFPFLSGQRAAGRQQPQYPTSNPQHYYGANFGQSGSPASPFGTPAPY